MVVALIDQRHAGRERRTNPRAACRVWPKPPPMITTRGLLFTQELPQELKHSFLDVVNVEEKLHFTWRVTKLRNVSLKIFLDLLRKITKPKATHLVIPFNNRSGIFLCRVLTDPVIDFFVSRAGRNELLEFHCVEPGKLSKVSA